MRIERFAVRAIGMAALTAASAGALLAQSSASAGGAGNIPTFEQLKRHTLARFSFGPTASDLDTIQDQAGLDAWFERQLAALPALTGVETSWIQSNLNPDTANNGWNFATLGSKQVYLGIYSQSQLREVMTYFWENLFSTSATTIFGNPAQVPPNYTNTANVGNRNGLLLWRENNAYRNQALTSFGAVLRASFDSGAMRSYLNVNVMYDGDVNEDYTRELLELHTIGPEGALGEENYTPVDINLMAQMFSGFGTDRTTGLGIFEPLNHNPPQPPAALFAATTNPDLQPFHFTGDTSGQQVYDLLDHLARQVQTKKFICNRMIEFFVGDPVAHDSDLMDGCIAAWDTGGGDGDIKEVLRAIRNSSEFRAAATGKPRVKTPLEYCISQARLFGGMVHGSSGDQDDSLLRMTRFMQSAGQALFLHPSPDGYPIESEKQISTAAHYARYQLSSVLGSPVEDETDPDSADDELMFDIAALTANRVDADPALSIDSAPDVAAALLNLGVSWRSGSLEQDQCELFLNQDANGNASPWDPNASDATARLELVCAYIAALPQSFEK